MKVLLRAVVVVDKVLILDLERRLGGGRLGLVFLLPRARPLTRPRRVSNGHLVERWERTVQDLANSMSSCGHCHSLSLQQPVDPLPRRELAYVTSASALIGGTCDRHDDLPQTADMAAMVKQKFLCVFRLRDAKPPTCWSASPPDPPPLRTSAYSVFVLATP